jgi:hypothetical protein
MGGWEDRLAQDRMDRMDRMPRSAAPVVWSLAALLVPWASPSTGKQRQKRATGQATVPEE